MDAIAGATAGPFAAVCAVLVFAGVSKLRRPLATGPAAAALGLPASPAAVRMLGGAEVLTAGAALAAGAFAAAGVAVLYTALSLAAWRLLARSPGTACGCLGASDAPVSATHVVVNVAAAGVSLLAIAAGSPLAEVSGGVWSHLAFVMLVGCCAWLVAALLDALPALNTAVRQGGSR
jgi:hypothetical protein